VSRNGNGNGNGNGHGHGHGNGHGNGHAVVNGGARAAATGSASAARHAVVVALLAGAAAGAGPLPGVAGDARAEPPAPPRGGLLEAGGGFGRYTEGLGDADVQFARLTLAPRASQQWRFEVAREQRFDDESWNFGLLWTRLLAGGASVNVGVSRGTGDYIAPDYRVDAGATVPLAGFVLNPGVNFIRSKAANRNAGAGLGVLRYAGPWLLAAHGRADFGEPGGTASTAFGGGVTYLVWRRTHVGAGAEWGDVSYQLVGPGEALVDYRSHAYHVALSQWFDARTGLNLRLDYGDTPFYVVRGATLSLFREW
jgi:YaiO family outer membrane protein